MIPHPRVSIGAGPKTSSAKASAPEDLEIRLAQARPDKRDPADYAKRTVARAKESLAMESLAKESLAKESLAMEMER